MGKAAFLVQLIVLLMKNRGNAWLAQLELFLTMIQENVNVLIIHFGMETPV
jgi:hypothetical protein